MGKTVTELSDVDVVGKIVGYYRYLPAFPPTLTLGLAVIALYVAGGFILVAGLEGPHLVDRAVMIGVLCLALPTFIAEFLSTLAVKDRALNLRRRLSTTLSLTAAWLTLSGLTVLVLRLTGFEASVGGVLLASLLPLTPLRLFLWASMSFEPKSRILAAALTYLLPLVPAWWMVPLSPLEVAVFLSLTFVLVAVVSLFMRFMDGRAFERLRVRATSFTKAFTASWLCDLHAPLEACLTRVGEKTQVGLDMLAFSSKEGFKTLLVVPNIHPGPFKQVGSSTLPYQLSVNLSKKLGCEVLVFHGVSTHELDLTSQVENLKVVNEVLRTTIPPARGLASRFVRAEKGDAKASCQLFGDAALITLTFSPRPFEDIPLSFLAEASEVCEKFGVKPLLVDAHNSFGYEFAITDIDLKNLLDAVCKAVDACVKEPRHVPKVGVGRVRPRGVTAKEGIGYDGVTMVAVEVAGQTVAYVLIDGNNLLSGLRERIIAVLQEELGFDDAEVMTTDNHMISGVPVSDKGYNAVGEAVEPERVISWVLDAAKKALASMEECLSSHVRVEVDDVVTLGGGAMEKLYEVMTFIVSMTKKFFLMLFIPLTVVFMGTLIILA